MTSAPRIIFVAGMGRSGSTLLDRLLGAVDGVCAVGELRWIWSLGFRENQFCGCGKRFRGCPFWTAVIHEALGEPENVDADGLHQRQENLLRMKWLPLLGPGLLPSKGLRDDLAEFRAIRARLYAAIRGVANASTVVDSSKFPGYGLALRGAENFDLKTVHLVRDARATAYSISRERDPGVEGRGSYRYVRGAPTVALNWLALNAAAELGWLLRGDYLRLRYEDLARRPSQALGRILRFARIEAPPPPETGPNTFALGVQHTLAGNPMRMQTGATSVHPDEAWRANLGRGSRWAATVLASPGLIRYRYL